MTCKQKMVKIEAVLGKREEFRMLDDRWVEQMVGQILDRLVGIENLLMRLVEQVVEREEEDDE